MPTELQPPAELPRQRRIALAAIALFALLSTLAAVFSRGALEGDATTHYLYARFSIPEPHYLLDVWGRPFCTAIYALPALLGHRLGARIASMLIAVAIGLLCFRVARRQEYRHPALALIFLFAQPLLFLHSFSTLTELPFALLLAVALVFYQDKRLYLFALIVGLMPTARPEGFGFIILAALAMLAHRKPGAIPLLLLPLLAWSLTGWLVYGRPQPWYREIPLWLPHAWPYAAESLYGRKNFFFLSAMLPGIVGPFIFPALPIGIWRSLRQPPADHRQRVQWIIAITPLLILLGHSYLAWRGQMASSGELRYLLTVAPMWALLMACGWQWLFETLHLGRTFSVAAVCCLLPVAVNFLHYRVVPLRLSQEGMRAEEVAAWVQRCPYRKAYPRLIATDRDVYYYLDLSTSDGTRTAEWHRRTIAPDAAGILLVWDPVYGQYNSDANRVMSASEILAAGWIPVKCFDHPPGSRETDSAIQRLAHRVNKDALAPWIVFLSPLDDSGKPTDPRLRITLPTTRPADD